MAIIPQAGYIVDPTNSNAVIRDPNASIGIGGTPVTTAPQQQPIAQAPVTPVPQQQTPAAPVVNINNAPQTGTQSQNTGSTAPQSGQPTPSSKALLMPANGSVVDLLNASGHDASYAARQQLATQYGIQGYTGTAAQNQELSQKYLAAFNANKSQPTPQSGADARTAINDYFDQNQQQDDPQKSFFDQYMTMNPVVKTMYDSINQMLSTPATTQTFQEEYQNLFKDAGIPALQTDLMNIKNIMDGTEDDIRNEITKTGGMATESQVQALAGARNKTLLKQANSLQQQLALKEDYVDHLMQFSQLDRAEVDKQVEVKLGLQGKLADLQDKITSAAKDNYKTIVDKIGFNGLAAAMQNDPAQMHLAEQAMGLPNGTLQNEAFLATEKAKENKALQFVSGTDNQASGVFNPNTGVFTPRGGGGGGSGGGTSGFSGASAASSDPTYNSALQTALTTILGSGTFTKQQQANLVNAVKNSADPFTTIRNQAKNVMGQTLATNLSNNEKAKSSLQSLNSALDQYYKAGGKTDIFKGNYEDAAAKLGTVSDPKLRTLATQIESALQIYRNAVSGTAYSVQEGKAISAIFPGINKTEGLNQAIISGRLSAFDSVIDDAYGEVLGQNTYQALKQGQQQTAKSNPTMFPLLQTSQVEYGGKTYNVTANGEMTPADAFSKNSITFGKVAMK